MGSESFTFVYDEAIGKVVMLGGLTGAKRYNDTWVLNHGIGSAIHRPWT